MEPSEIRELAIKCLHRAVLEMMSYEWHQEVAKLPEAEQKKARLVALSLYNEKVRLENAVLEAIRAQLKQHEKELMDGIDRLSKELESIKQVKDVLDAASSLLSVVGKVVAVTAAPSAAPLAIVRELMKARSDHDLRMVKYSLRDTEVFAMPPDAFVELEMPPEFSTEGAMVPLPIEEVLYGVELTPEKLIITVATGGCTGEDSFHVEVNKGYTGLPPYLVTVYRIVSDNCKGIFEPMKIAFSREKLGLDGLVEFILLNKIGNTSQHRLKS